MSEQAWWRCQHTETFNTVWLPYKPVGPYDCVPFVRKSDYDALHAEAEALRAALLGIASVNPAERGIEWAKSYASDGLKGAGSELYARWLETFKEAEALRDQNRDLRIEADGWFSRVNGVEDKLEALLAENGRLAESLRVAHHNLSVGFDTEASLTNQLEAARGLLRELIGAVRSINQGPRHAIMIKGDDEPCYWQRKEWVDYVLGLCTEAEVALTATRAPEVHAEQGERQEAACWVPRACLDKLRNGRNNSPTVLTDGPAEFNDTPLYTTPQPGQDVRALVDALEVSVDYLDSNTLNSIASGSTCHRKMRNALAAHRQA